MQKPGQNPTRRNRNIGTSAQGHGVDNRLSIPSSWRESRIWYELLKTYRRTILPIADSNLTFIEEATSPDYVHACTTKDIAYMLSLIPRQDWEGIAGIVFRQSTKKQKLLRPSWGRLAYLADIGQPGKKPALEGPCIFLEAIDPSKPIKWSTRLALSDQEELERLALDGHTLERSKKQILVHSDINSVRATQLYRTLLHEIGHWVDWLQKVVRPSELDDAKREELEGRYFARAKEEREKFAHNYAERMRTNLLSAGSIPFTRKLETDSTL